HTIGKHGPTRTVEPQMVFELAFEGIQTSPRHKSGLALRFPRIARIRADKSLHEADTIETARILLHQHRNPAGTSE
ncbi:MAG: ATP-dependent DNA ligase, partial [Phycisphaerales bacterium]